MVLNRYFLLLLVSCSLMGQDLKVDYSPIRSSGTLPPDFCESTRKKVEEENKKIGAKGYYEKLATLSFNVEANYYLDKYLLGGVVLVNDPAGIYVNKIVDLLLKDQPELRSELKVHVAKNTDVNAACYARGYLIIDIGLLAQVDNEAELAYVLCHEIGHHVKKHTLQRYIEMDKIDRKDYRLPGADRVLKKFAYSRSNETEADLFGLDIFLKSAYASGNALKLMEVLQYSYLPFDEIEFKKEFFEDDNYKLPQDYFLQGSPPIVNDDNYDDTKSTHPNIRKRKKAIQDTLAKRALPAGGEDFLVSKEEFYAVRDLSRMELCRLFLVERDYVNSFYSTYLLLRQYPNNLYLNKCFVKNLFAMASLKSGLLTLNNTRILKVGVDDHEKAEGKIRQVYHFLEKIPEKELLTLALRETWKVHQKFPNENLFRDYADSVMIRMSRRGISRNEFTDSTRAEVMSGVSKRFIADSSALANSDSKYDKIKLGQLQRSLPGTKYYKFAFASLLKNDDQFKKRFFEKVKDSALQVNGVEGLKTFSAPKKVSKDKVLHTDTSASLAIQKVLLLEPSYFYYNERTSDGASLVAADLKQENFVAVIKQISAKLGVGIELIDPGTFTPEKIKEFNDYSSLKDWLEERNGQGADVVVPVFNTDEIVDVIARYGTKYCLLTELRHVRSKGLGPVTVYYSILFDLATGKVILKDISEIYTRDTGDLMKAYVYDSFLKIRKK